MNMKFNYFDDAKHNVYSGINEWIKPVFRIKNVKSGLIFFGLILYFSME